jgi:hypothetical protein
MTNLNRNLLLTDEFQEFDFESSLNGTSSRGTYNPMQFVIRLRDDIHKALNQSEMNYEKVQAFSTVMHENIHWWQHVGSHIGFLTSLSYPALAHESHRDLKILIARNEKFKSILAYDKLYYSINGKHDNSEVNRILNNWHDIQYAKSFIFDNKNVHKIINDKRFFLSIGHCFHILWTSSINTLAATIDPHYNFLPKINEWSKEFKRLESEKVPGFDIDSGLGISPLGTRAIFEGQARFNQLQYLAIALNNKLTYADFESEGMLKGIYVEAFDWFIKITEINKPDNLNNSIIGLFLLVCDIAINPTDGFPLNILQYETFIISNDPGCRFIMICQAIKKDKEKWTNAVYNYSKAEYVNLSEELSKAIVCLPPLWGSAAVMNWAKDNKSVQELLEEESEMKFNPNNLSIRLFTSKYIRFQEDKLTYPNIFCWTGKSMTAEACKEINFELVEKIFNKHRALYIDDLDGDIKPIIFEGFSEKNITDTFQAFYTYNTTYDMIIQWILHRGEFDYNYDWLTSKNSGQEMKEWIRNNFKSAFDIYPEELKIL